MSSKSNYYLHADALSSEKIRPILGFIHDNDTDILLGINSTGGDIHTTKFLLKVLDLNKERVSLMIVGGAYSAAFELFYLFKGKRLMTYGCTGMYHYGRTTVGIADNQKPHYNDDKCLLASCSIYQIETERIAKDIMTQKEFKLLKKNEDVYFNFNRMKEIFPDAEVW